VGFELGFKSGAWVFIRFDGFNFISWVLFQECCAGVLVPAASSGFVGLGGSSLMSSGVASEFLFQLVLSSTVIVGSTGVVRLRPRVVSGG